MVCSSERVPDWLLERLAVDDLPAARTRALRERLVATGEEQRLDALSASNAEILNAHPASQVMTEVRRRAGRAPLAWRPIWTLSFAAAGAAAMALLFMRAPAGQPPSQLRLGHSEQETIISKGLQPSLGLYRKTPTGVERLETSAHLHPGDVIQVRYIAAGKRYGVVASCDARGVVTLHLPETPGPAVGLVKDGERALAHAYELDNSPGFERFVFVTADEPFDTEPVVRSLKQGAVLSPALATWTIAFAKDAP